MRCAGLGTGWGRRALRRVQGPGDEPLRRLGAPDHEQRDVVLGAVAADQVGHHVGAGGLRGGHLRVEGAAEPLQRVVEVLAAPLDEPVGEQAEQATLHQLDLDGVPIYARLNPQHQLGGEVDQLRARAGARYHRRQVPGGREPDDAGLRVEDGVDHGGGLAGLEVLDLSVQPLDHGGRVAELECVGAQRAAQPAHHGGGGQAVAHHVPDGEADPPTGQREHVVPVAPDAGQAARHVARGKVEPWEGG
jgi:hypothetical protein